MNEHDCIAFSLVQRGVVDWCCLISGREKGCWRALENREKFNEECVIILNMVDDVDLTEIDESVENTECTFV
jgi:hypothetical protein